ncbi:hypothetical protein [Paraburkholderia sp. BL10I2N1]|uniref:hypothetical protein n=1 Tax=Paraburkholderia sp. BL10I2N1 TaxID=1938796 RepID=UPI0010610970|nr:hypothetical protein [Paraburkholderia sp. BL10I2N1]TDN59005.1 hypothetical protein B0G77_8189 [Paraburkholderia sp. BL10I2N1]
MKKQIILATITAALVSAGCLLLAQPAGAAESAIEVAFSPDGGAERLVLRTIDGGQRSIRVMAYDFTSPTVVRALIAAKKRGVVDIAAIVHGHCHIGGPRRSCTRCAWRIDLRGHSCAHGQCVSDTARQP